MGLSCAVRTGVTVQDVEVQVVMPPGKDLLKAVGLKSSPKQRGHILITHSGELMDKYLD